MLPSPRVRIVIIATAVLVGTVLSGLYLRIKQRQREQQQRELNSIQDLRHLETAFDDEASASQIYAKHRATGEFGLRFADFWERKERRDEAILTLLEVAAKTGALDESRRAASLIVDDYTRLERTIWRQGGLRQVSLGPDGKTVVTASFDSSSSSWSIDGSSVASKQMNAVRATAVALSDDGRTAVLAAGKNASLWYLDEGKSGHVLNHADEISSVVISNGGDIVVTVSGVGRIQLWDAKTGQPRASVEGVESVQALAVSPSGDRVVLTGTGFGGDVLLWTTNTQRVAKMPFRHFLYHKVYGVAAAAFSPDGAMVATAGADATARVWEAASANPRVRILQHSGDVDAVAFSPDGKLVATGSGGTARLWKATTGEFVGPELRHNGVSTMSTVRFTPDGKSLLTGSEDGLVRLWRVDPDGFNGPLLHGMVRKADLSSDGKLAATIGDNGAFAWRLSEAEWRPLQLPCQNPPEDVAVSGTGDLILVQCRDLVSIWKTDGHNVVLAETLKFVGMESWHFPTIALSRDGRWGLVAYRDFFMVFEGLTGQRLFSTGVNGSVVSAAFSPDGLTIATKNSDGLVQSWKSSPGEVHWGTPFHHGEAASVHVVQAASLAFSPDSKTLASVREDSRGRTAVDLSLWRVETGQPINPRLFLGSSTVTDMAFSPDGRNVFMLTYNWLHALSFDGLSIKYRFGRVLQAGHVPGGFSLHGDKALNVLLYRSDDTVQLKTIPFDLSDVEPLKGDLKAQLAEWERKLGLRFDTKQRRFVHLTE